MASAMERSQSTCVPAGSSRSRPRRATAPQPSRCARVTRARGPTPLADSLLGSRRASARRSYCSEAWSRRRPIAVERSAFFAAPRPTRRRSSCCSPRARSGNSRWHWSEGKRCSSSRRCSARSMRHVLLRPRSLLESQGQSRSRSRSRIQRHPSAASRSCDRRATRMARRDRYLLQPSRCPLHRRARRRESPRAA